MREFAAAAKPPRAAVTPGEVPATSALTSAPDRRPPPTGAPAIRETLKTAVKRKEAP